MTFTPKTGPASRRTGGFQERNTKRPPWARLTFGGSDAWPLRRSA